MTAVQPIYLKDYKKPDYLISHVELTFDLAEHLTQVSARLEIISNTEATELPPLVLHGHETLTLKKILVNAQALTPEEYSVAADRLTIKKVASRFVVETQVEIHPEANTALMGLYQSNALFCTQCEAEGFRRITYFLDRPDVMSVYTVMINADKERYPVLLSNGNLIGKGDLPNNKHWVKWQDPFKKPAYLFALVAGQLVEIADKFITASGREVALKIFVEEPNRNKCAHAMQSLQQAMRWDEQVYGLEYDLDTFMIVAVSDFNMGAMENKGLNIFNARYIIADPLTATDQDYHAIQGVIGHEYFHNWSGNRVTCRDWFQLSLKEGFTIFRDQEFSAAMSSPVVCRINDVKMLRTRQFAEDAGPLSHPVQPQAYLEINNFYTATVYNKGAEVIRMLRTYIGDKAFYQGAAKYFQRHDGQAATIEDFLQAMADVAQVDLTQFKLWYTQSGTPQLTITTEYDQTEHRFSLKVAQVCPPTADQPIKQPLLIPLVVGLLGFRGKEIPLQLSGEATAGDTTRTLVMTQPQQTFTFVNVPYSPVPSVLRHFSAPVKVEIDLDDDDLLFLLRYDRDGFNQFEAMQQLAVRQIFNLVTRRPRHWFINDTLPEALQYLLERPVTDPALLAELLVLPEERYLHELQTPIDVASIYQVRKYLQQFLVNIFAQQFLALYHSHQIDGPYLFNAAAAGQRSLKNACLSYLGAASNEKFLHLSLEQYDSANNLTDQLAALRILVNSADPAAVEALARCEKQWQDEPLLMDKWFALHAQSERPGTLAQVKALTAHPAFNIRNPNRVRALIGTFSQGNLAQFHAESGEGYAFLADWVIQLDSANPQLAARLLEPLTRFQRYLPQQQALMQQQLQRIAQQPKLSTDVYEMVAKSLNSG